MTVLNQYLLVIVLCMCTFTLRSQNAGEHVELNRVNSNASQAAPYVILISADGFRYDYAEKYSATNLLAFSDSGVRAASMVPAFPSLTFPNHYTIATGMYPAHHGVVNNYFYDRSRKQVYSMRNRNTVEDGSWYGGTPLWVLAEQHRMVTASSYFVGSEAAIQGIRPSYWFKYGRAGSITQRVDQVVEWLSLPEDRRPHLVMFYMSEVDDAGHSFGPDSKQNEKAVLYVDSIIGVMNRKVAALQLPVNFIFLSDHGMARVDTSARLNPEALVDTSKFVTIRGSTIVQLYAKNASDIAPAYESLKKSGRGFHVYLRDEIPKKWSYSTSHDRFGRVGDIIVIPEYPNALSSWSGRINPGAHGFDPGMQEMHAVFYAWGPQFKKGLHIPSFENIHVYPLVCAILGLHYDQTIDGKKEVLNSLLREAK